MNLFEAVGGLVLKGAAKVGRGIIFLEEIFFWGGRCLTNPLYFRRLAHHTLIQIEKVGTDSLPVVAITALFTGMVLALQSYIGFSRFQAESLIGSVVVLSMTRELGPVLSSLMVTGRAGSAMAAELGTMRVTEQIDALTTMAVNPVRFLVVPRVLAATLVLPLLVMLADVIGVAGGYFVGVVVLEGNPVTYMDMTWRYLALEDIYVGLLKAGVFGFLLAAISCYRGFKASGGAEGVGNATTRAVVYSSISVLIADYFLTALLF